MSTFLRLKVNGIINVGGWSAKKLADELDMTEAMLSRIRSGTTVKVDWPTGQKIIEVWHAVNGVATHKQRLATEKKKARRLRYQLRDNDLEPVV